MTFQNCAKVITKEMADQLRLKHGKKIQFVDKRSYSERVEEAEFLRQKQLPKLRRPVDSHENLVRTYVQSKSTRCTKMETPKSNFGMSITSKAGSRWRQKNIQLIWQSLQSTCGKINNNFRKIMLSCFQIFSCAVIGWNVEVTILIEIYIFGSLRRQKSRQMQDFTNIIKAQKLLQNFLFVNFHLMHKWSVICQIHFENVRLCVRVTSLMNFDSDI